MGLGNRETMPDLAVVDPDMVMGMPAQLTADTGIDVLTHAIEGYTSSWHNDFSDGPCLVAARLAFQYLKRAVTDGSDREAREHMHNAATCGGLGFSNSLTSLAHTMGHALGAAFHVPHGRGVGLFLPYTIEYCMKEDPTRYAELARFLGCSDAGGTEGAQSLVKALRNLTVQIHEPVCLKDAGIDRAEFEAALDKLVDDAFNDTSIVSSIRAPNYDEFRRVFEYAYDGKPVDF
jgi:alcohol dehydrogenase class IV